MPNLDQYPGLEAHLDAEAVGHEVEEQTVGIRTYVRVTQTFDEGEGDQLLFVIEDGVPALVASDNVVQFPSATAQIERFLGYEGTMSDAQHEAVARKAVESVDAFKTGIGPDHGVLACMWAARHVVHAAVGMWITQLDGTAGFYGELKAGGMTPVAADTLPPGAVIISPTEGRRVGHVGLLGAGTGGSRLVYSNHSPRTPIPWRAGSRTTPSRRSRPSTTGGTCRRCSTGSPNRLTRRRRRPPLRSAAPERKQRPPGARMRDALGGRRAPTDADPGARRTLPQIHAKACVQVLCEVSTRITAKPPSSGSPEFLSWQPSSLQPRQVLVLRTEP